MDKSKPSAKTHPGSSDTSPISLVPLAECPEPIRAKLFKCIDPIDLNMISRSSEYVYRDLLKQQLVGFIDAEFENGKTMLTVTSEEGAKSVIQLGRDLLELSKSYTSLKTRTVSIKWDQRSGRNGYRSIFNSFYFLPKSLGRYKMEQGTMRFLCETLKVTSEATDDESVDQLHASIHSFKVTKYLEIEGRMISFIDLLNVPTFYLHSGKWLSEEDFLRLESSIAIIVLTDFENSWKLTDIGFNLFLCKWIEGKKNVRFIEVGSPDRRPTPVTEAKMAVLGNSLDWKPTKFNSKSFELPEFKRSVTCQGGWDIKSKKGETGTILRTKGKFTFLVWPSEVAQD